jgi:hypothetical protein
MIRLTLNADQVMRLLYRDYCECMPEHRMPYKRFQIHVQTLTRCSKQELAGMWNDFAEFCQEDHRPPIAGAFVAAAMTFDRVKARARAARN